MMKVGFNRHFHRGRYVSYHFLLSMIVAIFSAFASLAQPAINSTPVDVGAYGVSYTYSVTTGTWPIPGNLEITLIAGAPGLTLADHHDGTATLSGTPTGAGTFPIAIAVRDITDEQTSTQNFDLNVAKAVLTVFADDKIRPYGSAGNGFTFSYAGFRNSDNVGSLATPPSATTIATMNSGAGSYAIVPADAADENYNFNYVNGNLTITPVPLTITANNLSKIYGADLPDFTLSYSGLVADDNPSDIQDPPDISTTAAANSNVGSYSISLANGSDPNYIFTLVDGTLTVTKATLTIKADDKSKNYNTVNPTLTFTYAGFAGTDSETVLDLKPTIGTLATTTSNSDTYVITVSGGHDNNYDYAYVNGTLTINKVVLTITADPKSRAYGAANPIFTFVYSGFVNGENTLALTTLPTATSAGPEANAGTHQIVPSGAVAANYTFNYVNGVLTVTKVPLTITADSQSKVYGAAMPPLTMTFSGFIAGENSSVIEDPPQISTTAAATSNIGPYAISLANGSDVNYSFVRVAGTLTVTKAVITARADDKSRVYGAANPAFTVAYTGFVNGDNITSISQGIASTLATTTSNVGSHAITPSGASASNYSFSYIDGALMITPALVTITAANAARSYGSPEPIFTFTYSGLKNGETAATAFTQQPTASVNASIASDAGNYVITPGGALAANYTFAYATGTLFITKVTLNAFVEPKTKTYGQPNPTFTIIYLGFRNGENASVIATPPGFSTPATTTSNAGTYTITSSGGLDENYLFNNLPSTLTITKAVLIATADNTSRVYGAANPAFTVTYSGFIGTDGPGDILTPPALGTLAGPTTSVSNQTITVSGAVDENYSFSYVSGTMAITKATLTATPDDKSRPYGAANPTFSVTYTGFANGELPNVINTPAMGSTVAGATSDVGAYSITAANASDNNYDFIYNAGTLTITRATLTVTANNQSRTYGAANPTLSLTYNGLQNGDVPGTVDTPAPAASTTATTASPVGSYDITLGSTTGKNYTYSLVNGTLAVTKATLTITAENKTRIYNTANPPLTRIYSGFLNGDSEASISPPAISTSATLTSSVGNYAIGFTAGSATNYTLVPVPGTLTITKATPVATWNNPATITYGTPLGATQLNASANVGGTFDYSPVGGTVMNAGANQTLTATFNPSDLTNYNIVTDITATISVIKATPVITWANPAAIIYGILLNSTSQLNATSNAAGAFTYTPNVGTLLTVGANQTLKADFHPTDASNYNDVLNIQRSITVNKAMPIVTWSNPVPITYPTPLSATQLNATFSVPGTPTYLPGAGTILPTGDNQPISVSFTPTDQANYNSVFGSQVLITVVKATPFITWASPADIIYGTALNTTNHLNPTHNVPGSFTFNPPAGTILSAGSAQTLTATFTPTDGANYTSVTNISTTINVSKANPVITWAALSPITYGTALSATQLNAGANVPGGFVYNPVLGTVLNAGSNQAVSSTFTPTDQANYNTIVTNKTITVNKATPFVTWASPATITYGTPLGSTQQNASANVPGTYIYTPLPGTILNTGTNQNISVRFEPTDATNYNVVPITTTQITVVKATPVMTWATPLPIKVDVALSATQLNATADVAGAKIYSPDFGTSFGVEGTYTLHVAFTPTDQTNYNSVPNTQVQIVVSSKDNPVITWSDPGPIVYGTLLSATQLNALASVPGSYSYSPAIGAKLNAGASRNLTVTFTPSDLVNYNIVSKTVHIAVDKAMLTATAANASRAYGNSNPSFIVNYSGFVGTDNASMIDTPTTMNCAAIASDPAGGTFPIVPSGGLDNNYQFTYVDGTLTINKAPLIATADNKSRSYGISNPPFTISYSGFANGDEESDITPPTPATVAVIASNVGNYSITLSGGAASNYNITLASGTLSVTQALLVVVGDNLTKIYGAALPTLTFKYLGFMNGETPSVVGTPPSVSTTATPASPVGVYAINVSGGSAQNYSLALFVPGSLTVNKAPLTIAAVDKTKVYGQANPLNTRSYSGFVNGDDPGDITLPIFNGPNATVTSDAGGFYPIQLSGGSAVNYDITLQDGSLTITKASLTAKAGDASRVYGQNNPGFTISYTGFHNGDDPGDITPPAAGTTATITSNVGSYAITLTGGTATNYSFVFQSGSLTITPAALTARAADRTRTYGFTTLTFVITYTGFLNGDDATSITQPTPSTTGTTTSNIGTYPITLAGGSAPNYTLTLQPGTLTISKANLTVTADNKTKVYGGLIPPNTLSYVGFRNGDDAGDITLPDITGPDATSNSPVGTYPVTLKDGSAANYNLALVDGQLTITKAPLTAKADNQSRPYGGGDPVFTITYTGFVAGDNPNTIVKPSPTTSATVTSNAGPYPITLNGVTTNYDFTFISGTLTITKAPVIIIAENKTRIYGIGNPALTVLYSGLANNESPAVIDIAPTITTTATNNTTVSALPIQVSGAVDGNYSFTYVAGSLTITKAPLAATADNKSRPYGSANPAITITYTGFMNNEGPSAITQPTIGTSATISSPVGAYPITLTGGSAINYQLTSQNGTLTITPVILTVKAINQSRNYGANNPGLTLTYTGFVSGEDIPDLDTAPIATTTATATSPVGPYPITASGGADSNYGFAYTAGTMTVNKATLTATTDTKSTTYGTIPALTITYSGFMNGENVDVLDTQPITSTTATTTSNLGPYPISLNGGADNNYNLVNLAGTLTIGKAPLIVAADDKSRIIGLANPEFTIGYSGFMNNETIVDIDNLPTAGTVATIASPPGTYPINVSGGTDDHYEFVYQGGTLTVVLDNPPVVKNFQVETDEDTRFTFTLGLFASNYTDDPNGKIIYIKISSLPLNGTLFKGGARVVAGDEIAVIAGQLADLSYVPNSNYAGNDAFGWNLFDGSFLAVNNANVTVKIHPVNDSPVLSNIEPNSLLYSPGDPSVQVTAQIIINDVDDSFIFSASVVIASNHTQGDELSVQGGVSGTKIEASYDQSAGELKLIGKDTRTAYETILKKVTFNSPVNGEATISEKNVTLIVRDSIADSNIASRKIEITEVFPELDIVNAFTPNGDDVNDYWDIINLDSYTEIMISVFNREGTKVFSCNSRDCRWDGRAKGELQPAGAYSYVIDLNHGKRQYKGTVTVLR